MKTSVVRFVALSVAVAVTAAVIYFISYDPIKVGKSWLIPGTPSGHMTDGDDRVSVNAVPFVLGQDLTYAFFVRNEGALPVTVTDLMPDEGRSAMLKTVELRLGPRRYRGFSLLSSQGKFGSFRLERKEERAVYVTGRFESCKPQGQVIRNIIVRSRTLGVTSRQTVRLPSFLKITAPKGGC